ncbi:isochorismatase family cysteine hydrolase [Rhizobium rhizogenes]|uniref:isochorismatase family cysteine hydrolase n=1 Tax=Rhizobium rhizogenes TaxID=359 RepID=UPI0015733007|nr:isochorismatase family cysteine hydrolase [Rhizobium rhizogenes]NTH23379.1 cysteine hydrolase [Rhizobium rhizogenes]NTH36401.1 cysteine hydrolase [Rhizobium rhizogenes]
MTLHAIGIDTALVIIDLQQGTAKNPFIHPITGVIENASKLVTVFRRHQLPVVFVTFRPNARPKRNGSVAAGGQEAPVDFLSPLPALHPASEDIVIEKTTWSAFAGTELDPLLKERGITRLVLVGVATSIGIESSARAAYDLGYGLVVVSDAITDLRRETHDNSLERVFPILAEIGLTVDVIGAFED